MNSWIAALRDERAMYAAGPHPDRVIAVDEELARLGWCVDEAGELHEVDVTVTAPVSLDKPVESGKAVESGKGSPVVFKAPPS